MLRQSTELYLISKNDSSEQNRFKDTSQVEAIVNLIEKAYQATDNAEMQKEVDELLAAMESISTATALQDIPIQFECLEESSLVKAIDTMVLVLASHSSEEADKQRKLKQIRGLIQLINAFLKAGFYTDAIMPQQSIEALKLGAKL